MKKAHHQRGISGKGSCPHSVEAYLKKTQSHLDQGEYAGGDPKAPGHTASRDKQTHGHARANHCEGRRYGFSETEAAEKKTGAYAGDYRGKGNKKHQKTLLAVGNGKIILYKRINDAAHGLYKTVEDHISIYDKKNTCIRLMLIQGNSSIRFPVQPGSFAVRSVAPIKKRRKNPANAAKGVLCF
jgi:hypothetical protein